MEPHKILAEDHERTLVGEGISRFNLDGEHARGVVAVAASRSGQLLASDASRSIRNVLHQLAGRRGAVSKRQFDKAVVILTAMVKGQITEPEARAWVKRVVEHSDLRVRGRGLFRSKRWFRKIKAMK
jgi:predicted AlkP superfamily phosphohydrolase/phosphomutase